MVVWTLVFLVRSPSCSGEIGAAAEAGYFLPDGSPSPVATSNVVTVMVCHSDNIPIGVAKQLPDGEYVELTPSLVTAGSTEMGSCLYVEAPDRSAGVRVVRDQLAEEGDLVMVCGVMATSEGERQVYAWHVGIISSGNSLPVPLGMTGRTLMSRPDGAGLLVTIWGRISGVTPGAGHFYVDDGSGAHADSQYAGILLQGEAPGQPGQFVRVTGIAGAVEWDGGIVPIIRTRRASDIAPDGPWLPR
jgi:hypothetical protein